MESFPNPAANREASFHPQREGSSRSPLRYSPLVARCWIGFLFSTMPEPSTKFQDPSSLDSNAFVAEVQKARGRKNSVTAAGLRSIREEYARAIQPARLLAA